MIITTYHLVRFFFIVEILLFAGLYFLSPHGYTMINELKKENQLLEEKITTQQQEIEKLSEKIHTWNTSTLKKEKIAREELQMAHKDDIVYFL